MLKKSKKKKKKLHLTPQALLIFAAGTLMAMAPFVVLQSGYTGDVLVADERVAAPFDKSLILIDQHGIEGAIGVILNKPISEDQKAHLSAFIRDSGIPVGYGGPLGFLDRIEVLEEKKPLKPGEMARLVLSDWDDAVRANSHLLDDIRQSNKNGDQRYRIFTGITSWSPLQLESETLVRGAWHAIPSNHDLVFQNGAAAQWDALDRQEKAKKKLKADQS